MGLIRLTIQSQRFLLLTLALGLCMVAHRLDTCYADAHVPVAGDDGQVELDAHENISEEPQLDGRSPSISESLSGDATASSCTHQKSEFIEPCSTDPESKTETTFASKSTNIAETDNTIHNEEVQQEDPKRQTPVRIEIEEPVANIRPATPTRRDDPQYHKHPDDHHDSYLHASPGNDSGYGSSSDSVIGSETSPRSVCGSAMVTKAISMSSLPRHDMFHEMLSIKEKKKGLKQLLLTHPAWRLDGISLSRFDFHAKIRRFTAMQILILDRQEGMYIPLNKALSLRDLRARTGLCVALFDTMHQNFVTELHKAVHVNTPLEKIEATIYVWCRKSNTFESLGEMLASPELRESASLRIQHCERRPYIGISELVFTSWSSFVRNTDVEEFYLGELHREGVDGGLHLDCVLHTDCN